MTHIGTPTSRVDGRAKVTGAAKYAAEFNADTLVHGCVVTSTIARGRIRRIDASEALRVAGVIDVLTHHNRPHMARTDRSYKEDVSPPGAPLRPLYDDRIAHSGQPVALVLAEEWEIARFAANLVRVEYETEPHVTDLARERGAAFAPEKPITRGDADKALAAAQVRHDAEYSLPIEHHNAMELHAATVIREEDGKLRVYDKTQGVQSDVLRNILQLDSVGQGGADIQLDAEETDRGKRMFLYVLVHDRALFGGDDHLLLRRLRDDDFVGGGNA